VDPLTERFTLEDLGDRLAMVAQTESPPLRQAWFTNLVPVQRNAVVTALRHRGYSALSISNDFGLPELQVEKIYAEHVTQLGAQVLAVRLDTLVGQISAAKQRAQEMAIKKGDAGTFWRVEKEHTGLLQDLGVLERAAHKVEVVNKAEESKAAAFTRLVSLAEMKARRNVELKKIEATVVESLPADVEAGYAELKDA
jgi:hypothetical protein